MHGMISIKFTAVILVSSKTFGVKFREHGVNDPEKCTSAIRLIFVCKVCFCCCHERTV
jgi:hypothetical protein